MKLSASTLADYAGVATCPAYDRTQVQPGIVHLGFGAFHRAHQAAYLDSVLETDPRWGIRAISLRRPDVRNALFPQDWLYTLIEHSADKSTARVIGAVLDVEVGEASAIKAIADHTTKLVTITITEKGYTPEFAAMLVTALGMRAGSGAGPLTVLSCDNLSNNGAATEALVGRAVTDPIVERYIDVSVRFPSSMVDRITPATTDANKIEAKQLTGLNDAWPVFTERFSQWVIEDNFAGDRPDFPGVEWVSDVAPYEEAKLRLLNGTHTTLAMLGPMLGHSYVSDAVSDPVLRRLIDGTARQDAIPHLSLGKDVLDPYWKALLHRFENPNLRHALAQIASDTSQKIPQRLVAPLISARGAGRQGRGLVLAIASWIEHIRRAADTGAPLQDPMHDAFMALAKLPSDQAMDRLCASGSPLHGLSEDTVSDVCDIQREIAALSPEDLALWLTRFNEARDA